MAKDKDAIEESLQHVPVDYNVFNPEGEWTLLEQAAPANRGLMRNVGTNAVKHYVDLDFPIAGSAELLALVYP